MQGSIHIVGNTVLDSIDKTEYTGDLEVLCVHRRENHDDRQSSQ